MQKLTKILATSTLLAVLAANASATQYTTIVNGRELVVHTNPAPVLVHRVLPPYWNKHVTARELRNGRIPKSSSR